LSKAARMTGQHEHKPEGGRRQQTVETDAFHSTSPKFLRGRPHV
jgi:hypothetical protein